MLNIIVIYMSNTILTRWISRKIWPVRSPWALHIDTSHAK